MLPVTEMGREELTRHITRLEEQRKVAEARMELKEIRLIAERLKRARDLLAELVRTSDNRSYRK